MKTTSGYIDTGARISSDGLYRYRLWRMWDLHKPAIAFIGLNPSTADASVDDPTIRKCVKFAKLWGYGRLHMVNLFAFRATDPEDMKKAEDPVGSENDEYLKCVSEDSNTMIAAWGNHGVFLNRANVVQESFILHCLGTNKNGTPKHPLYLKDSTERRLYRKVEK